MSAWFSYRHTGDPGPNAPLAIKCSGCGSMTGDWTCWTEYERPRGAAIKRRVVGDLELCGACASRIMVLPAGSRFAKISRRVASAVREQAQIVAFIRKETSGVAYVSVRTLEEILQRVEMGGHHEAMRKDK